MVFILIGLFAGFLIYVGYLAMQGIKVQPQLINTPKSERDKCGHPLQLWLYDALRMRGHRVRANLSCGPYDIPIALPLYHMAILYGWDTDMPASEKVAYKQKERYLRRCGWRVSTIRSASLYRDFNKHLQKMEIYPVSKKTPH